VSKSKILAHKSKQKTTRKLINNKPAKMSVCSRYGLLTTVYIKRCDVMQFGRWEEYAASIFRVRNEGVRFL
jgi:hypothetical protein